MKKTLLSAAVAALLFPASVVFAQTTQPDPPTPPITAPPLPPIAITDDPLQTSDPTAVETKALAEAEAGLADAAKGMANVSIFSRDDLPKTQISLKVRDSKVTDALKNALEQAKLDFVLDEDIPDDPKVTLEVRNVRLEAVLDLLTENVGVRWRTEKKDGKTIVHVGKKVKQAQTITSYFEPLNGLKRLMVSRDGLNNPFVYSFDTEETRSTFTCTNCHNQITIVKKNVAAKCPTCGRTFEPNWKVCPFDGTARPVAQDTWKFCPICAFPIPPTANVTQTAPVTSVTVTSKDATSTPPAPAKP